MDPHALAIEYVEPHCDLVERLRALPPSAHVRGVVFTSIKEALRRTGKLEEFGAQFGAFRYESLALYPLAEYMVRLASAGAFLRSPQAVYEGIGEISRLNAAEMTKRLLGQALLHELAAEPERLLEQGLAMRRQVCKYGRWELLTHAPRHVEVRYVDEYVWIRQAWTYAALVTFEGCSIKTRITTTL